MNRLAQAASPYLRQHAGNPVDWYPWGEEAFRRAREEDKPIFLSIGYSTCHWCHVMARESLRGSGDVADAAERSTSLPSRSTGRSGRTSTAVYMSGLPGV